MSKKKKRKVKPLTSEDFCNIHDPTRDINEILTELEYKNAVKIMYAVLVGSRMTGLYKEESDYNVRFVYRRPLEEYLTLEKKENIINYTEYEYQFTGWDLDKTLTEHYNSTLELLTWINSPIKYREDKEIHFEKLIPFDRNYILTEYTEIAKKKWECHKKDTPNNLTNENLRNYVHLIYYVCSWDILYYDKKFPPQTIKELLRKDWKIPKYMIEHIICFINSYTSGKSHIGYYELSNMNAWLHNSLQIMKNSNPLRYPRRERMHYHNTVFQELVQRPII